MRIEGTRERTEKPLGPGWGKRRVVWGTLAAILILYVFVATRVRPVAAFGSHADDALYFASAKSLAQGHGYFLPSFPIRLKASKYPKLYPLLLAGVWKLDPQFPGNVAIAAALTMAFGCGALLFIFLLLRRWPGLGDWQALGIVALCAFNFYFLELSASVMTGIPFLAAMLGAIWLADGFTGIARTTTPGNGPANHRYSGQGLVRGAAGWSAVGAGLLAGLSVSLRSLGVAAVAGIGLTLLLRREYRRLLWFCAAAAPLTLLALWPALTSLLHPAGARLAVGLRGTGWSQTVCYYSSYACSWRMNVSGPAALKGVVLTNLKLVFEAPGLLLLGPLHAPNLFWTILLVSLISLAAYAGIARYLRRAGWQALPLVFAFYLLVVLPWPYPIRRFLLLFLPLFCGGLWIEARHLATLVAENWRRSRPLGERAAAGLVAAAGLMLAVLIAISYSYAMPSKLASEAARNSKILAAQQGAYVWLGQHAAPGARVIAYEDGLLYLYTGKRAVVPIAWDTEGIYDGDHQFESHDVADMADVARHIRASYWLATRWDFALDGPERHALLRRENQLLAAAPVVYRDASGKVRLYDVSCLTGAAGLGCPEKKAARGGR